MRAALVIAMIIAAAFFRAVVGVSKKRGRIMAAGTLGGLASGVALAYRISQRFDVDVSALSASFGMMLGWAVAWVWARRTPRESY